MSCEQEYNLRQCTETKAVGVSHHSRQQPSVRAANLRLGDKADSPKSQANSQVQQGEVNSSSPDAGLHKVKT